MYRTCKTLRAVPQLVLIILVEVLSQGHHSAPAFSACTAYFTVLLFSIGQCEIPETTLIFRQQMPSPLWQSGTSVGGILASCKSRRFSPLTSVGLDSALRQNSALNTCTYFLKGNQTPFLLWVCDHFGEMQSIKRGETLRGDNSVCLFS